MRKYTLPLRRSALTLACTLATAVAQGRGVPAGFEDLVGGHVEQLNVRLYGRSAGLWPVHVSLENARIEKPQELMQALGLGEDARAALATSLSQPLRRNSHLACRRTQMDTGCGYLAPDDDPGIAQLILDEAQGELHLFVDPRWLPQGEHSDQRFHRNHPDGENALLHTHAINASGSRDDHFFNVQASNVLGAFDYGHAAAEWNYLYARTHGQPAQARFDLDSLYYRHDLGHRHYVQFGRMDSRNLSSRLGGNFSFNLLPVERIHGLRVGTSAAYRTKGADADATPITVLLARDARVDVLDGDRLLRSHYLPAGVNTLDTRDLPNGSLQLTLRIYEDGRLARSEQVPFSKQTRWHQDAVEWFAQSGVRHGASRNKNAGFSITQIGARVPLGKHAGLTVGAVQIDDSSSVEARLDLRHGWGQSELRGQFVELRGSDGSYGSEQQLSYHGKIAFNLQQQKRQGMACTGRTSSYERLGCSRSRSASVSMPALGGTAHLGYTDRISHARTWPSWVDQDDAAAWLPTPPPSVSVEPQRQRGWQLSLNRAWVGKRHHFSLSAGAWQQRFSTDVSTDRGLHASLTIRQTQRPTGDSQLRRLTLDTRVPDHGRADHGIDISETRQRETTQSIMELSGSAQMRNDGRYGVNASANLNNDLGAHGAALSWRKQNDRSLLSYSVNHASSLSASRHGIHWGGASISSNGSSALLMKVDKTDGLAADTSVAELALHGHRASHLRSGKQRLFTLPGYQLHKGELLDSTDAEAAVSIKLRNPGYLAETFLSPGKLLALPVSLQLTYTYIGNAVDTQGNGVHGARILNAPGAALPRDGGFMLELPAQENTLYLLQDDHLLSCPMVVQQRRSVAWLVGDVQCTDLALDQLPARINAQAHVRQMLRDIALPIPTLLPAAVSPGATP